MDAIEIVRLLTDADGGGETGPIRPGGYAVVGYDLEAVIDEEDENYDDDLEDLEIWGTASSAARAFDLLGDTLAARFGDTVDETVEHHLENGVAVNEFEQWFEGDEGAIALLKAKPTDSRKMLMFLLYDYYAPMNHLDEANQPHDVYLGTAAKLFTGARLLYGASASPPYHEDALGVFELQPTDREDGSNSLDDRGMSPLHHAVARGDLDEVTTLLEDGADPNLQAEYGNSPHFAAIDRNGHTSSVLEKLDADRWAIAKTLLDHGGEVNSRDRLGRTLIDLAVQTLPYPAETVDALLARGARSFILKPDAIDKWMTHCFYTNADGVQAQLNQIRYVLDAGAERRGLLHRLFEVASVYGRGVPDNRLAALVEFLLSQGVRDEEVDGKTAVDLARDWVDRGYSRDQAAIDLIEASASHT